MRLRYDVCHEIPFCAVVLVVAFFTSYMAAQERTEAATSLNLVPAPREVRALGVAPLRYGLDVAVQSSNAEDEFAAQDLINWARGLSITTGANPHALRIVLLRRHDSTAGQLLRKSSLPWDNAMHDEGYAIVPDGKGMAVIAETSAGVFYGVQTIKQLLLVDKSGAKLQIVALRDWPAMKYRGLSDDLSRGGIPTLDHLKRQIRTFAAYKINIYSPYFETSFQYASSPITALPGAGITPEEGRELSAYARKYHITILPEQEAFGHLHHLLVYQQYASLAETPMGSVLAPGQPGSLDLISKWFTELASVFPGPMLHIGADETFDLGKGQTKEEVNAQGLAHVYVDFLNSVYQKLAPLNRRLLFWGDIAMLDPSEVKRVPKDMIAVAWVYEFHPDGYGKWLKPYVDNGMETWVAPGVSNWRRVYPDNNVALHNIQRFVADGQADRSTGTLNTSWNDDGEEIFSMNWYGVLFGAAAAWQQGTSDITRYQESYGPVFHGDMSGAVNQAEQEMMKALALLGEDKFLQMTDLPFWADPWGPEGMAFAAKLRPIAPQLRLHAENVVTLVAQARRQPNLRETNALDALELGARKLDFIGQKFQAADLAATMYQDAYNAQNDPKRAADVIENLWNIYGLCQDMGDSYDELGREYRQLWLRGYRSYSLENVMSRYRRSSDLWQERSNKFFQAIIVYQATKKLPSLTDLIGEAPDARSPSMSK